MELGELEERYWHDFNDFQIQLRAHVDERDVLLRKVPHPYCTAAQIRALPHQILQQELFSQAQL